ncbi:unnamed protein product [Cylicostephanus goldi]|uniref:CDK5RAP3-like protein n=1 Tax=Cylicostephanus goldi TaxID=71465 RepID=A0A3P7M310_CYLGO|nr:unnamed protein product [Cylicostephanus goldi]
MKDWQVISPLFFSHFYQYFPKKNLSPLFTSFSFTSEYHNIFGYKNFKNESSLGNRLFIQEEQCVSGRIRSGHTGFSQVLQRLVQYEIPGLKKQITKAEQALTDSVKKEKDYLKQADDGRKLYEKELSRIGIRGHALRAELLALAADLPSFFAQVTDDIIHLKEARDYYLHFRDYIHQGKKLPSEILPLLSLLLEKGAALTAFEFKYGTAPSRIEAPSFDLLLKEDEKKSDGDEIDFGDDDIDFGDDIEVDTSAIVADIDVVADTSGAIGESVARGEDALGVVENPDTQKIIKNELSECLCFSVSLCSGVALNVEYLIKQGLLLNESYLFQLLAFLTMRKEDEERETSSDMFIRGFEKRPAEVGKVSLAQLGDWISKINSILSQLSDQQKIHLFRIRSSPQYVSLEGAFVEKLVEEIEAKRGLEGRYKKMAALMVEKQKEAQEQTAKAGQELQTVIASTKQLQKKLEEEISKKYDGRRVNIMGGITAALATR